MRAAGEGIIVEQFGDGSGGGAVRRAGWSELLKSGDLKHGEHAGQRSGRNIRDPGERLERLRRVQRVHAKAAARPAETQLIHRLWRHGPGVLGSHSIGAGQRIGVGGGGQVAAAIGQGRHGARIVAQERIAREEALRGPTVIQADVELIGAIGIGAAAEVIVGDGFGTGRSEDVRRGIAAQQARCRGIEARQWNGAVRKRRAHSTAGRVGDGTGEHPLALQAGGHGAETRHAGVQARSLVVHEEEGAIAPQRTAQHAAVILEA